MGIGEGFTAVINNISLFDYIQLIKMTGKTRTIEISSSNRKAIIQLIKGKIEFAKTANIKGEEAFLEILTWRGGTLKELNFKQRLKKNIKDTGSLLLKAAEHIDNLEMQKDRVKNAREKEFIQDSVYMHTNNILKNEDSIEFAEDQIPTEITTNSLLESNHFLEDDLDKKSKKFIPNKRNKFQKCELMDSCSLLKELDSEILVNAWKLSYCSNMVSSQNCARKKEYFANEKVIRTGLLPNGKIRV